MPGGNGIHTLFGCGADMAPSEALLVAMGAHMAMNV